MERKEKRLHAERKELAGGEMTSSLANKFTKSAGWRGRDEAFWCSRIANLPLRSSPHKLKEKVVITAYGVFYLLESTYLVEHDSAISE